MSVPMNYFLTTSHKEKQRSKDRTSFHGDSEKRNDLYGTRTAAADIV